MIVELREPKTANDFALYYDLRWRVLRRPWTHDRESSKDEHEEDAIHLMAWSDNELVGVGRVHFNSEEEAQVRYMAVEEGYTGQQVGSIILQALEVQARNCGAKLMVLNARDAALSFYQKHKYCLMRQSDTLFDSVIHWRMYKRLDASD